MVGSIFLFGDQHYNFAETSRPFIEAAGGASAKIAMLTEGGERASPYVARITAPWKDIGVEVVILGPVQYAGEPDEAMAQKLRECSGIFMCGGETRNYQRIYVESLLGDIIRERYWEGVPYAGVSAGALLAAGDCALWGGVVTTATNEYYARYRGCYDPAEGSIELQIGKGLGLLHGCVFEPHFAEVGGFPRLVTVMERTGVTDGYGLDEPICLVFEGGKPAQVLGRGRLYHLRRQGERKFELEVHEPGEELQ
ncbi:MAG TPA: Type 1 glutamine amidotransferase-like domain-containing protein [Chloroflexia bacterium]|nr:Type 1 glutamine amidotransferase-like domain-containing protein [Chloroflexia bacterium]